jgi:hypothetical protein
MTYLYVLLFVTYFFPDEYSAFGNRHLFPEDFVMFFFQFVVMDSCILMSHDLNTPYIML